MTRILLLVAALALTVTLANTAFAEAKTGEWTVTAGCAHCNYSDATGAKSCAPAAKMADGKVVLLKGDAVKDVQYKKGGQYIVKGTLAEDGKSIEVTSITAKAKEA